MEHAIDEAGSDAQHLIATLAHPVMLEILVALHDSPMSVSHLAQRLEYEISAISRRLNSLHAISLVQYSRIGRSHVYRLTPAVQVHYTAERCQIAITTRRGTSVRIGFLRNRL